MMFTYQTIGCICKTYFINSLSTVLIASRIILCLHYIYLCTVLTYFVLINTKTYSYVYTLRKCLHLFIYTNQ